MHLQVELVSLKSEVDKLDIDELEKVPTCLNSLKSKAGELDVGKLVPVPGDLCNSVMQLNMMLLKRLNVMNWLNKLMLFRLLILVIQSKN